MTGSPKSLSQIKNKRAPSASVEVQKRTSTILSSLVFVPVTLEPTIENENYDPNVILSTSRDNSFLPEFVGTFPKAEHRKQQTRGKREVV